MTTILTRDREPVDLALWRSGRQSVADVEAALDGNFGLAAQPALPPAGVAIALPPPAAATILRTISLWD